MSPRSTTQPGIARRYDYDDRVVLVADLGPGADASVEVDDGTAVVTTPDGRRRTIDLPPGEVRAFNRNGVVTLEVRP